MSDLDIVEFADNPDPRCPCVLLLDTSFSMNGQPIGALNEGLRVFQQDIQTDALAQRRSEIAVVTFGNGGVSILDHLVGDLVPANQSTPPQRPFVTAQAFQAPQLTAGDYTPMGEAIHVALDLIHRRKDDYKGNGIPYYRPWIFMVTDGNPTDSWTSSAERIHAESARGGVVFFAVGVPPHTDFDLLRQIAPPERPPVQLHDLRFSDMFAWLSQSQRDVSTRMVGGPVALSSASEWAQSPTNDGSTGIVGGQVALPPIPGWGMV